MGLIDRINVVLPTVKPLEVMHPDFMPLAKELGFPDEWRGKPLTAEKVIKFLESKRDELSNDR